MTSTISLIVPANMVTVNGTKQDDPHVNGTSTNGDSKKKPEIVIVWQ